MLWYKNWLETRWTLAFFLLLLGIPLSGAILSLFHGRGPDPTGSVHGALTSVLVIMVTSSMLLAGSGVRTPSGAFSTMINAKSCAMYTLSLPVSRYRLLLMRSAIGLFEVIALGFVYVVILWISELRLQISIFDIGGLFLTIIVCAVPFYFIATFFSTFLNEIYSLYVNCLVLGLCITLGLTGRLPSFLNVSLITRYAVETGAIPWIQMVPCLAVGGVFILAALKAADSLDY